MNESKTAQPILTSNMSDDELLRVVDRAEPVVKMLAERLEFANDELDLHVGIIKDHTALQIKNAVITDKEISKSENTILTDFDFVVDESINKDSATGFNDSEIELDEEITMEDALNYVQDATEYQTTAPQLPGNYIRSVNEIKWTKIKDERDFEVLKVAYNFLISFTEKRTPQPVEDNHDGLTLVVL